MSEACLPKYLTNPDPNLYLTGEALWLDFETTNVEKGTALNADNRIVLACWEDKHGQHYQFGGELDQQELVKACNEADFLVAHNAKFELQWLARCGYDIGSKPVYCTFAAEWVIAGNRRYPLNLNACSERRNFGTKDNLVGRLMDAGVCPSDIPRSILLRYCKRDVELTRRLFTAQLDEVSTTRLLPVIYTRCLTIPPLADIETNGLHLDAERVEKEYEETLAEYLKVMAEMDELTGGINPKSTNQVAEFVYGELGFEEKRDKKGNYIRNKPNKRFPGGAPKCDEGTLLSLGVKTDRQKEFMDLKKAQGRLSSALDKNLSMFVGACREHDSVIYANLLQGRTITHRLASSGRRTYYKMFDAEKGCQFQNLPRKYKKLFSPRHDEWYIGEADGAQLEFRVAGHLGNDDVIRAEVSDGYDVHLFTQKVISEAGGKKITRTQAKAHTFKPLYGGESGTDAEKAYYTAFGEKYCALKEVQDDWCVRVGAVYELETEWGLKFYWPHAEYYRSGRLNVKTNVYNTPVQSFATAEIIPIALTFFWHRTRDAQMFLVNTVHDSIEAEFPPEERELFEKTAVQSLTEDVYTYLDQVYRVKFSVPLGVGMVIGHHWGEPLEGEDEIKIQVEVPDA
jgi:DNA polymerase I-like protein with 3'-5' exonuclease and polymerase domains